jgi:putative membrane protein
MIMYLLFWAGAILVGVRLVKRYAIRIVDVRVNEDAAISILRERYAKGEIDSEEFKQRKADLDQNQ